MNKSHPEGCSCEDCARPDLDKAEGDRGGRVIGHTKSGKPIYASSNVGRKEHSKWSPEEHQEASALHSKHAEEAKRKNDYLAHQKHSAMSEKHRLAAQGKKD